MKSTAFAFFSTLLIFALLSCKKDATEEVPIPEQVAVPCNAHIPISKGERSIGLDLLNNAETGPFEQNMEMAQELGMDFIALHTQWSGLEPNPGEYADPFDAVSLLGQVAATNNMKLSLTIRPIDLTGKTVPSDLENEPFNSALMNERFAQLIDHVFTLVEPQHLHNIMIGNEIDAYDTSSEDPDFWSHYGVFLFNAKTHINSIAPNLKVGYTATHSGLLNNTSVFQALNQAVDIMGVTYYPLAPDFNVEEPFVVLEDLDALCSAFSNSTIYLQEVGYQSSPTCGSSEDMQAEFFCHFFEAWDDHAEQIESAEIVRLHDLSLEQATVEALPYGVNNENFLEYLRTLGLRSYSGNGEAKQAYTTVKEQMAERGWQ